MLPNLSLKVRSAARPVHVVPFALLLLGIAFAILAPRYSPAAASGYALARVSLLWILVPFVAVLIVPVTAYGGFGEIGEIPVGWFVPVGVELMLAAWLVSRHRGWSWSALVLGVLVVPVTAIILRFAAIAPSLMI